MPSLNAFTFFFPPILSRSWAGIVPKKQPFLFALIGNSTHNVKSLETRFKLLKLDVLPRTNVYKISVIFKEKNIFPTFVKK